VCVCVCVWGGGGEVQSRMCMHGEMVCGFQNGEGERQKGCCCGVERGKA
jgi:hypothetical protein